MLKPTNASFQPDICSSWIFTLGIESPKSTPMVELPGARLIYRLGSFADPRHSRLFGGLLLEFYSPFVLGHPPYGHEAQNLELHQYLVKLGRGALVPVLVQSLEQVVVRSAPLLLDPFECCVREGIFHQVHFVRETAKMAVTMEV